MKHPSEPINRRQRLPLCECGQVMRVTGTCPACANREMFANARATVNANAAKGERVRRGGKSPVFTFARNDHADRFARGRR